MLAIFVQACDIADHNLHTSVISEGIILHAGESFHQAQKVSMFTYF